MEDWLLIEDIEFNDNIVRLSCDTRDFYCIKTDTYEYFPQLDISTMSKYPERFFMTIEEVKNVLLHLREISGGVEPTWRMVSFKGVRDKSGWDFKYLRVFKTKLGYIMGRDFNNTYQFEKKTFWYTAELNKEYLNAH